jgi:hypothetical protein
VDLREGALVLARQCRARRAVGLVADDQVEIAPLIARNLLRAVNDLNRLIGREDDLSLGNKLSNGLAFGGSYSAD